MSSMGVPLEWSVVEARCRSHRLDLCGVVAVPVAARSEGEVERQAYRAYLASGHHGDMSYLERHEAGKLQPQHLLPACRALVVVGMGYHQRDEQPTAAGGRVARYAWGRDYHKVLSSRLRGLAADLQDAAPGSAVRVASDATPLLETYYAERAGVGFRGKHTLVISRPYGSWFFIGEVLTTAEVVGVPSPGISERKRCGVACRHCIDICPTGAIHAPYQLDASRCISYLTIEHRGPIDEALRPLIGDWLFGCDLCQEVCPWSVRARETEEADLRSHRAGPRLSVEELLQIASHEQMVARFAGSPLMRAGRDRLVRNACTVAANTGAVGQLPRLRRLQGDRDQGVAEHAAWAVRQLEQER